MNPDLEYEQIYGFAQGVAQVLRHASECDISNLPSWMSKVMVADSTFNHTALHICQYHNQKFIGDSILNRRTPSKEHYPIPSLSHNQYQSAEVVALRAQNRGSVRKPFERGLYMKSTFRISRLCTVRLGNTRKSSNGRIGRPPCFGTRFVKQQHWGLNSTLTRDMSRQDTHRKPCDTQTRNLFATSVFSNAEVLPRSSFRLPVSFPFTIACRPRVSSSVVPP